MAKKEFNNRAADSQLRRVFLGAADIHRCDRCNRELPSKYGYVFKETPTKEFGVYGPVCREYVEKSLAEASIDIDKTVHQIMEKVKKEPRVKRKPSVVEETIKPAPALDYDLTPYEPMFPFEDTPPVATKKPTTKMSKEFNEKASMFDRSIIFVTKKVPQMVTSFITRVKNWKNTL